jgi:hypothetical protein
MADIGDYEEALILKTVFSLTEANCGEGVSVPASNNMECTYNENQQIDEVYYQHDSVRSFSYSPHPLVV